MSLKRLFMCSFVDGEKYNNEWMEGHELAVPRFFLKWREKWIFKLFYKVFEWLLRQIIREDNKKVIWTREEKDRKKNKKMDIAK